MAESAAVEAGTVRVKRQRQSAVMVRRLAKNPTAMIGFVLFMIMLITAVFAPLIATHPYDEQNIEDRLQGPSAEAFVVSAPIIRRLIDIGEGPRVPRLEGRFRLVAFQVFSETQIRFAHIPGELKGHCFGFTRLQGEWHECGRPG